MKRNIDTRKPGVRWQPYHTFSVDVSDTPEENAPQSSAGSKDTPPAQQATPAEKRATPQFQRDTRRPGTRWQPTQKVQATFDAVKAQRTPQHSDDEDTARQVLHDAVAKVFADAATRGKKQLKEKGAC